MLAANVNELQHPLLAFSQEYPDHAVLIPCHVVRQLARRSYFLNSLYPRGINAAQINNQLLSCSDLSVPSTPWVDYFNYYCCFLPNGQHWFLATQDSDGQGINLE